MLTFLKLLNEIGFGVTRRPFILAGKRGGGKGKNEIPGQRLFHC